MAENEERKKAFVVFASTYEAAKYLTLEQKGELFEKLGAYSLEGKDVRSDNPMIDIILISAFPNMDAAERRHQAAIENGKKGKDKGGGIGAPRKGETKEEYQARVMEWRRSREESNNPQEPLNNNTDINIDKKRNTDIDNEKEININTNIEVISDSISTNLLSSSDSSNFEREKTDQGEEPKQERPRIEVISSSNGQEDSRDQEGEDDSDPSDPPVWLTSDPNYRPQPIDDGWNPQPPVLQHKAAVYSNGTYDDDPPIICDGGTPLDLIEQTPAPTKPKSRREELNDLIETCVAMALDTEEADGKTPEFWLYMVQARDAYVELHYCDEKTAEKEIAWKLHCLKNNREQKRRIAAQTRKPA